MDLLYQAAAMVRDQLVAAWMGLRQSNFSFETNDDDGDGSNFDMALASIVVPNLVAENWRPFASRILGPLVAMTSYWRSFAYRIVRPLLEKMVQSVANADRRRTVAVTTGAGVGGICLAIWISRQERTRRRPLLPPQHDSPLQRSFPDLVTSPSPTSVMDLHDPIQLVVVKNGVDLHVEDLKHRFFACQDNLVDLTISIEKSTLHEQGHWPNTEPFMAKVIKSLSDLSVLRHLCILGTPRATAASVYEVRIPAVSLAIFLDSHTHGPRESLCLKSVQPCGTAAQIQKLCSSFQTNTSLRRLVLDDVMFASTSSGDNRNSPLMATADDREGYLIPLARAIRHNTTGNLNEIAIVSQPLSWKCIQALEEMVRGNPSLCHVRYNCLIPHGREFVDLCLRLNRQGRATWSRVRWVDELISQNDILLHLVEDLEALGNLYSYLLVGVDKLFP